MLSWSLALIIIIFFINTIKNSDVVVCITIKLNCPTNHNKTNIRILRIFNNKKFYAAHHYNTCGLKIHLSDFLKASMSPIDLIWFSRAFQRIIDLYEHDFVTISVLGLGDLKVIFLLRS